MAFENEVCIHCINFQSTLAEKENEIEQLKLHIQNLSNLLLWKDSQTDENSDFNDSKTVNEPNKNEQKFYSSDWFFISCNLLDKHVIMNSKSVQTDDSGNLNILDEVVENDVNSGVYQSQAGNLQDYVYDKNYEMYYSLTTGYYYDEKSGLMYEPQSGKYYRYNYDKKEYEEAYSEEENKDMQNDKTNSNICDSVVNQVNNLNLNDESIKVETSKDEIKTVSTEEYESSVNKDENYDMINAIPPETDNVSLGCAKDWQPEEGSQLTVTDIVKQVVDDHNNMSDYVYNELYQMYYSPSTGYFYDAVRKLLYDPTSGSYYYYDTEKQTYEFYCQTELNAAEKVSSTMNHDSVDKERLISRKKYWKKKIDSSKQNHELKPDNDDENKSEDPDEEFSSLEDGEILSSDSESEFSAHIVRSPVKGSCSKQKSAEESCPPSIRAIVENSEHLQIGSLILITCYGGIVGRDKTNAIYIPDVCVSKVHAEIKYDSCLEIYNIKDLGSQNGTFINDKRLSEPKIKSEPCTLNHGDKLSLGSCKLLLHIHEGHDTCDECEPGQVLAEISSHADKNVAYISKEEKEKNRREELRRLKKKYGLQGAHFEQKTNVIVNENYKDKAEIRRQTVGSDNPYEKTQEASIDVSMPQTNKGYQMLKKMGWKEGQTLGATDSGLVEPIPLRPWTSKAGLGSSGELLPGHPEDKRSKKWVKAQERYFQLSLGRGSSS